MKTSKLNTVSFYIQLVLTALLVASGQLGFALFSGVITFQYYQLSRANELLEALIESKKQGDSE